MTLDELLTMWESDSAIDSNHLDVSSIDTAKLHSKYLKLLVNVRLRKSKSEMDLNELRRLKWRYYRGEMTRQELQDLNWEPWQYAKPLKVELDEILKSDADMLQKQARIDYLTTMYDTITSIMQQIKQRDWQIRNAVDFKKFLAGT